jgi:Na+/H+ antiporter NhaD/arsenite permease-like protein
LLGLFLIPGVASAAGPRAPLDVPLWTVVPFAGLLLSIALVPVIFPSLWHSNRNRALIVLGFTLPLAAYLVGLEWTTGQPAVEAMLDAAEEYTSFIILLAALYVVAGGILVEADWRPTPGRNTFLLAAGAVLANLIGTTGASMVLIRPMLRINRGRKRAHHVPIFFIFIVSNLGGLLTPLGDPPLFLGFLRGVSFFWTFGLWPHWLLANGLVLAIFFCWDGAARKDEGGGMKDEKDKSSADSSFILPPSFPRRNLVRGKLNIVLLVGILVTVLLHSTDFSERLTAIIRHFLPCPDLGLAWPYGELVLVVIVSLSLALTPAGLRQANDFGWEAIVEVAILFAGIFLTMMPALDLLARHGRDLGVTEPWQYFWLTGSLSAVLDNAPTYLTFATIAAGNRSIGELPTQAPLLLQAISCGAVFMGAMTYVGNGPNFMVRAIAVRSGYPMPSFFGYLGYAGIILTPIFLLTTWLFFPP